MRCSAARLRVPVFSRESGELAAFIYRSGASMEDDGSCLADGADDRQTGHRVTTTEGGRPMTETTPDAATTVRRVLDAFMAGDAETFMSHIDDNIEWNPAEHHPFLTHQYLGKQQYAEDAVATIPAVMDDFRVDLRRVLYCADVAVTELRYHGTVKRSGQTVDVQSAIVWEVRDGKVIRAQEYMDTWEFMNAWQGS
jgi:uncharacterized protein